MKTMLTVFLAGALAFGGCAASFAISLPFATVTVDGTTYDVSNQLVASGNSYSFAPNANITTTDGTNIGFSGTSKYNASSFTYGLTLQNAPDGAHTYAFDFGVPVASAPVGSTTIASVGGTLIDVSDNGLTVPYSQDANANGTTSTNGTSLNLGITGTGIVGPGRAGDSVPFASPNKTGFSSFIISSLATHLTFSLPVDSVNGDVVSFTGGINVNAPAGSVPEPGTLALLVGVAVPAVFGGLRAARRRR